MDSVLTIGEAAGAEVFMARQAVLDRNLNLYGYELLYRSSRANQFDGTDGDAASEQVMARAALVFGTTALLGGKRAFINFTHRLLVSGLPALLPPQALVIEVLETAPADCALLKACQQLRERGYLVALDDYVDAPATRQAAKLADIIKVDFRATPEPERRRLAEQFTRGPRLLAEKVESYAEFEAARSLGYELFQGHFFGRPAMMERRAIPAHKMHLIRLLAEVQRPLIAFAEVEHLIREQTALCYQLLRFVNSAVSPAVQPVRSIREALVLAGEATLRRLLALAAMHSLASDKPHELVVMAAVRARFAESLATQAGLGARSSDLFLMGMFSLLHAMVGRPLDELLSDLHLPPDIHHALVTAGAGDDPPSLIFRLILAYERADWEAVDQLLPRLGVAETALSGLYAEAAQWSRSAFI